MSVQATRARLHTSQGFTLIELLVVMGIMGILATLMFTNFSGARSRARDTERKNDLAQLKTALRLYYNDYQSYPDDANNKINGCGASGSEACDWGAESFTAGAAGAVYMNQVPQDPLYDANTGTPSYSYALGTTNDTFTISTTLENLSDPSIQESQEKCGVATPDESTYMVCAD